MSEAATEPAATKKTRDPEFWIAIGAFLVSAIAMVTSLLQVSMQRNQERALVWPHVAVGPGYSAEGFRFVAKNKGLGPALVHQVEIKVGAKVLADWRSVIDELLGPDHGYGWDRISGNDLAGHVLSADETRVMFGIGWDAATRKAFGQNTQLSVRVCYCSFLGECWWSNDGLAHDPVSQCPG